MKRMFHHVKKIGVLLMVIAFLCVSCKATRKSHRTKGCDCPTWSKAETEILKHEQERV